ncbi:MCP four helix bundle domain-containing protein [Asticcacaulis sp. EMRT-3]|uniref:MCP four helix bundle domain-containing protein n=1 Tax=Asticcacaulis sp. EMRT-3 TaxID=3040349 RepID=UPI0024AEB5E5|nr:MCP four helix bundle domain-containing protein [Asticcacaulis sp. EMRT-3]MDI7775252.1 MCP four helix bundle domain-containing protein [Asticcacaulis sp. EMRT-3]
MSIRARIMALMACFALMALAVTALGLATISDYNRMMKTYGHAYENAWRGERLNHLVSNVVMDSRGIYLARNAEERDSFATNLRNNLDEVERLLAQWRADATPQELQKMQPILNQAQAFIVVRRDVIQLAFSGQQSAAEKRGVDSRNDRIAFQNNVETLVNVMRDDLKVTQAQVDRYSHRRAGEFLIAALVGIFVMMGLSLWIVAHFITRPLQDVASAIIKTSKGDYEVALNEHQGQDEVSSVWQALAVLKARAIEAERLAAAQREAEHQEEMKLREILLD